MDGERGDARRSASSLLNFPFLADCRLDADCHYATQQIEVLSYRKYYYLLDPRSDWDLRYFVNTGTRDRDRETSSELDSGTPAQLVILSIHYFSFSFSSFSIIFRLEEGSLSGFVGS